VVSQARQHRLPVFCQSPSSRSNSPLNGTNLSHATPHELRQHTPPTKADGGIQTQMLSEIYVFYQHLFAHATNLQGRTSRRFY
jgi:hypothetical protein